MKNTADTSTKLTSSVVPVFGSVGCPLILYRTGTDSYFAVCSGFDSEAPTPSARNAVSAAPACGAKRVALAPHGATCIAAAPIGRLTAPGY
jgi:hypothetical protein